MSDSDHSPDSVTPHTEIERYVITTPKGFTETFSADDIRILVALGLIVHDYDGHVLQDAHGNGVGALHHFYREAR